MRSMSAATATAQAVGRLAAGTRTKGELPIVLLVDVEPDGRAFDPDDPGGWDGFEAILPQLPGLRERLGAATGAPVHFTWCLRMDPQVGDTWGSPAWVVDEYGEVLHGLAEMGDELALHTHDWRWSEDDGDWTAINGDPEWERHIIEMAIKSFRESFGRDCRVHRGGAHFVSPTMLDALGRGGVQVDMTAEAGLVPTGAVFEGEIFVGKNPDYSNVPMMPYRTSDRTFPMPDPEASSGPMIVPLSCAPTRRGGRAPLSIWSSPGAFATRMAMAAVRRERPFHVFVARSDITLKPQWEYALANLEHLAGIRGARFVTASEATAPYLSA
jgi:hypothetical protein